jgi:hypothetical protein
MKTYLLVLAFGLSALTATTASASSGAVHGRLMFYQNQGSFCPTSRDCTDAHYLASQFNTNQPFAHTKVYFIDNYGVVMGQSTTDVNGYYTIAWTSGSWPTPSSAYIRTRFEHKDLRFTITTGMGLYQYGDTSTFVPVAGGSPQEIGTYTFGTSGAPNEVANAYDGAWRTWYYSLQSSNLMLQNFSNLIIRAFSNENGNCSTSCSFPSQNLIILDTNGAGYKPQGRVMHEMGHIASFKSNPFTFAATYNWPSGGAGGSWGYQTPEWRGPQFEEGVATYFGDVGMYWANNPTPHTCTVSAAPCTLGTHNIEYSDWVGPPPGSGCITTPSIIQDRWALQVDRYIWDIYDKIDDGWYGDLMNREHYEIFDTLDTFGDGIGDTQDDEPWGDAGHTTIDDADGRGAYDFSYNFTSLTGASSAPQGANNCFP